MRIFVLMVLLSVWISVAAQPIRVGLIPTGNAENPEYKAAMEFIRHRDGLSYISFMPGDITGQYLRDQCDVLWIHGSDTLPADQNISYGPQVVAFVEAGGGLLLSPEAFPLIHRWGLEPAPPALQYKELPDEGYGRKAGYHAFLYHPVFDGLHGGTYVLSPPTDTTVRVFGYFGNDAPQKGRVVAVDWDYIFLREERKMIVEYSPANGRIIAVGGYITLSGANHQRVQLEHFLNNTLMFLAGREMSSAPLYWSYREQVVEPFDYNLPYLLLPDKGPWKPVSEDQEMSLNKNKGSDQFWDVAGKRILVMGKEKGGIDEIWIHPFMGMHDLEAGVVTGHSDSVIWLSEIPCRITVLPYCLIRTYNLGRTEITETVTADPEDPACAVHYRFEGPDRNRLLFRATSSLRLMWPYSEHALRELRYNYNTSLNALIVTDGDERFSCLAGFSERPMTHEAGRFEEFDVRLEPVKDSLPGIVLSGVPGNAFEVRGMFLFDMMPGAELTVFVAGSSIELPDAIREYNGAAGHGENILNRAEARAGEVQRQSVRIVTPEASFNEGYRWAIEATDRFFVHTPGLGSGLVAGYSTTATGWDGGHNISGRPGYGWYFGRDGQWSGFALLHNGNFEKVRDNLQLFIHFQDLNGKIFHELSTSGFVHYDAADATPLFIVLAGRYLRHSGDLDFIRDHWDGISKAVDYCYSTDTDGDRLIENTMVGHGWVEGGGLFGSHTSLYLASCWAEALREASAMAGAIGLAEESEQYAKESLAVTDIINARFWNESGDTYYHGIYRDGTFLQEPSVMPAIPILFGQAEPEKAAQALIPLAGEGFTSDWGCRIVSKESSLFNPRGYHTGSVWPLFTGWVSLAEYRTGKSVQGFTHLMNNLLVYRHWGLGFVEEVLHGGRYEPSGVCRHQCWSETMVIQPVIEGMLGFRPDAMNNRAYLSPQFPLQWDTVDVDHLRVGNHTLGFTMTRSGKNLVYHFRHEGPEPIELHLKPQMLFGSEPTRILLRRSFESKRLEPAEEVVASFDTEAVFEFQVSGGIGMILPAPLPLPGDSTSETRVLSEEFTDDTYSLTLQGRAGSGSRLTCRYTGTEPVSVEGAKLKTQEGEILNLIISFDNTTDPWPVRTVQIRTKR
ncbi:MAG: hypothetical protein JW861_13085 [Bacteroidales bacterium]|nr:hypothetical protein [Bacteroidales bacterium]